jgi:DNA-binding response OmpR family regulator
MKANFLSPEESALPTGNVNPARNRILVVDDDASVREMLARVLVGENYRVWSADNGDTALKIAATEKIDLVLLDLNLPGKNGWDTFERLTIQDPLLTVIIITARSNQLFTALGAGVAALLEKPLNFPKLLQTISRLLAEPVEARRARLAGDPVDFQYLHAGKKSQKS